MFRSKRTSPGGEAGVPAREEALSCRPVRNCDVREEELSSRCIRLAYPVAYRPIFARLLGRGNTDRILWRKLELDELGTAAWRMCDGANTVADMVEAFASRYKLNDSEVETAMASFLRDLGRRGVIGFQEP